MRSRAKLMLLVLTAALVLGAAVENASATRIELSERQILVLFRAVSFISQGWTIACELNLEGSFHSRTFSKISGLLIGYITEAVFRRPCTRFSAWALNGVELLPSGVTSTNTLPWHIRFGSFFGTLPRFTGIDFQFLGVSILLETFENKCLYKSTNIKPMVGFSAVEDGVSGHRAGQLTALRGVTEFRIPKFEGAPILCPSEFEWEGTGVIATQGTWALIFARLVP